MYDVGDTATLLRGDYAGRKVTVVRFTWKSNVKYATVRISFYGGREKDIDVRPTSLGTKEEFEAIRTAQRSGAMARITSQPASTQGLLQLPEPIKAYRHFMINTRKRLAAWNNQDFEWLPAWTGPTIASCSLGTAPCSYGNRSYGHKCGLYALDYLPEPGGGPYTVNHEGDVLAAIELWGRVFAGSSGGVDKGYRAEFGTPTALLCENWQKADLIHRIADDYCIPVTHSRAELLSINWGARNAEAQALEQAMFGSTEEEQANGHRRGPEGTGSAAENPTDSRTCADPGATCRIAARGASTVARLRELMVAGEISRSNIDELLDEK